jgi:hypothetical protein
MTFPQLASLLALATIVIFLIVASFGPRVVRIPLMQASLSDWCMVPLFGLVVLAVVGL